MGKVRSGNIKRLARTIFELHPDLFTKDFEKNKEILNEKFMEYLPSKKVRNKVAGYIVKLVKLKEREKSEESTKIEAS